MSSLDQNNVPTKTQKRERKEKESKHPQQDTTNKENVMTDLGAHFALHAERMRLLKRAEEGLEKLSIDPLLAATHEPKKGQENLSMTQTITTKNTDYNSRLGEKKTSKLPMPASTARQRRRDKQEKSKIQIKDYRPGYTWNRGGRVKELRIRCLARKFSTIWKKNTFGRVMPSKARNHYNTGIMKMVFREWYDMWWHVRKEWRLMVRAECHFRYLAWTKYFEAWKQFVVLKKKKNQRVAIATDYDGKKVMRRAFSDWRNYISLKKEEKHKRVNAAGFYESCLVKKCWMVWKEKYEIKQERKNMGVVALQFWAYRLQLQHWMMWCDAYKKRQAVHSKERLASRHHKFYTMQRGLNAWMEYWTMKKRKREEKDYAEGIHHRCVLVRCMRTWVNQYNTRMLVRNQQTHIQDLAERFTKRRYFYRMMHYVEIQREKHEKEELAESYYMRKLKVVGVTAFRLYVVRQRTKEMQQQMAAEFYITMLSRRHWNRWMSRCEDNEELAIHSLTVKALQHYKLVICRKLVDAWLDYVEWRKHRQAQYDRADAFYYVRAMPVFLRHIKAHAELQKRNRKYSEMAVDFRRDNLSARFFYMWYNNFEQSRDDRMNERMAILHYESSSFRRFFICWRNRYNQAIEEHRREVEAVHYFNTVLCKKHLRAWRTYVEDLRLGEMNDGKATKHHYIHQLSRAFRLWKQYVVYKREQKRKKNIAEAFLRRKTYQRVLKVFKNNVNQGRQFWAIADERYAVQCQQLLRTTIRRWKENCDTQKEDRQTDHVALCHYHRKILGKVTTAWHRYAVIHAYKTSKKKQWVENTQKVLNYNKLQRYFTHWKEQRDQSLLDRLKTEQAVQHYNRVILQNLVNAWKLYVQVSIKDKVPIISALALKWLLNKQCNWFNEIRLTTWTLSLWKREHAKAQETARKSALALWHWSLSLQKQTLVAWYIYTQDRKRKKARITHALERRRTRLIRNGVTQWLSVADDLSALRAKFAAQQHASKAFTMHQIVQKCALHWRQWAGRRKAQRGFSGGPSIQQRVGFTVPHQTSFQRPLSATGLDHEQTLRIMEPSLDKQGPRSLPSFQPALGAITDPLGPSSTRDIQTMSDTVKSQQPDRDKRVLKPQVSDSPVKSKGVPESMPCKQVGFRLESNIPSRRKPRHPSFLAESLKKAGLFSGDSEDQDVIEPVPEGHQGEGDRPAGINIPLRSNPSAFGNLPQDIDRLAPIPKETYTEGSRLQEAKHLSDTFIINSKKDEVTPMSVEEETSTTNPGHGMTSTFQIRGFHDKPSTSEKGASDTENVTHPSEKSMSSITSDVKSDNTFTVPWKGYENFENKLMTPADFIGTKMTSTLTKDAVKEFPHVGLSPRDRIDGYSSINSTLKSKESMDLLSSAHDSGKFKLSSGFSTGSGSLKFKETGGFIKSADNTTPRSADSYLPINIDTPRAGTALANQITDIRNRLKEFNEKKKRLRKLQKQHVHLSDWLDKEVTQGEEVDTEVIRTEITEIEEDIRKLNQEIDVEKPICAKLVSEVQVLVKLLQGSETC